MKAIKNDYLFILLLAAGLTVIVFTISPALHFQSSNGKALFAFYIPLPFSVSYLLISTWKKKCTGRTIAMTLLLFIFLFLPFVKFLLLPYQHLPQNDGYRYGVAAKNIAAEKTLWGSDDISFGSNTRVYIMQPGYRYFLASWIVVFGKEIRGYQAFCMFLYLFMLSLLVQKLGACMPHDFSRKGIWCFLMLSAPFVVKLILLGLTEWLAITIFMFFLYAFLSRWTYSALIAVALLPFIRQNLLIFSLILFPILLKHFREKWKPALVYVLVILLPLYHNLYYAGKLIFFATYNNEDWFSIFNFQGSLSMRIIKTILYHLTLYSGIDMLANSLSSNFLSVLFIPLGTWVYVKCIVTLTGLERIKYILITGAAIIPTLILGWAYYPRFEWVNLMLAHLLFPLAGSLLNLQTLAYPDE